MGTASCGSACPSAWEGGPLLTGRLLVSNRYTPLAVLLALVLLACSVPVFGYTPAGTVVTNTATLTYDGGTISSNPAEFTVAQIAGVQIIPTTRTASGYQGATVCHAFTVSNVGNGDDEIQLSASSVNGWPVQIYRDDNADGVLQPTEVTTLASTGVLPAGGQMACLLAVAIPATAIGGDTENLTATSALDLSCSTSASYLTVSLVPLVAGFSGAPTSGTAPLTVSFTDQSTGGPTSWVWDFGDGQQSAVQNPSHIYASPGTYTVSLTVSNASGQNTATKSTYITVSASTLAADFDRVAKERCDPTDSAIR